jgi:hypothetical protein
MNRHMGVFSPQTFLRVPFQLDCELLKGRDVHSGFVTHPWSSVSGNMPDQVCIAVVDKMQSLPFQRF